MLLLTKLDNSKIMVSLASIKYFESVPDTIVFFLNGESVIVKENFNEIQSQVSPLRHHLNSTINAIDPVESNRLQTQDSGV